MDGLDSVAAYSVRTLLMAVVDAVRATISRFALVTPNHRAGAEEVKLSNLKFKPNSNLRRYVKHIHENRIGLLENAKKQVMLVLKISSF